MKTNFVEKTSLEALLRNIRACHRDSLVASDGLGLPDGAVDAIGDKAAVYLTPHFGRLMRHDKKRHVQGISPFHPCALSTGVYPPRAPQPSGFPHRVSGSIASGDLLVSIH